MDIKKELDNALGSAKKVFVTSHINPDMDAVASSLSITHYINTHHPDLHVDIVLEAVGIDDRSFLLGYDKITWTDNLSKEFKGHDIVIVCDVTTYDRVSKYHEEIDFDAATTFCFDHHPNDPDKFDYLLRDDSRASATEIIGELLFTDEDLKDPNLAELLLIGILSDTGFFRFIGKAQAKVFPYAQKLIELGDLRVDTITNKLRYFNEGSLRVLGELINNLKFIDNPNGEKYVYTYILDDFFNTHGITHLQFELGYDTFKATMLSALEDYYWGFVVTERDDMFRLSFRSAPNGRNVRDIAQQFNGGGHIQAAGGRIPFSETKDIAEAIDMVVKKINSMKLRAVDES